MAVCPSCRTEQAKRVNGRCPHCGVRVNIYGGRWVREDDGAPTVSVLRHFERWVSKGLSAETGVYVGFAVPRKGPRYSRELVTAERLLEMCDMDISLTTAVIDTLFTHKRFSFKSRNSLMSLERDFPVALALVRAVRKEEERRKVEQAQTVQDIAKVEDVFV